MVFHAKETVATIQTVKQQYAKAFDCVDHNKLENS